MWDQYRKSFARTQAFGLALTAVAFFYTGRMWLPTLLIFSATQISAIFGAWSAGKIEAKLKAIE